MNGEGSNNIGELGTTSGSWRGGGRAGEAGDKWPASKGCTGDWHRADHAEKQAGLPKYRRCEVRTVHNDGRTLTAGKGRKCTTSSTAHWTHCTNYTAATHCVQTALILRSTLRHCCDTWYPLHVQGIVTPGNAHVLCFCPWACVCKLAALPDLGINLCASSRNACRDFGQQDHIHNDTAVATHATSSKTNIKRFRTDFQHSAAHPHI